MTIVGTRPELIKMSRVIAEFDQHTQHILVHTGQNYDYELNQLFFEDLSIRKPDYFLDAVGENAAQTIGRVIEKSDAVMEQEKPDAIMFYGDTNSCLAVIAAKRRKIPVFHMEAGNRCFDQRVPEELNRKVLDHLSDINLVLTEHARRYLIDEGIRPETIIKTGSHMREVLDFYMPKIWQSDVLQSVRLTDEQFFIVSAHREENIDSSENMTDMVETLNALAEQYDMPVIVSTHPRTKKRLDGMKLGKLNSHIQFLKPFCFCDYIKLQMEALCVISDSGTISEETSILKFNAVNIRETHERHESMEEGTVPMTSFNFNQMLNVVESVMSNKNEKINTCSDYNKSNISVIICRIILSYLNFTKKYIRKDN